jgi:hypothetical protein
MLRRVQQGIDPVGESAPTQDQEPGDAGPNSRAAG